MLSQLKNSEGLYSHALRNFYFLSRKKFLYCRVAEHNISEGMMKSFEVGSAYYLRLMQLSKDASNAENSRFLSSES